MKLIAIGDIHGRNAWKKISATDSFEKIIFLGGYFDTQESISAQQQKENFVEILLYKEMYPDKVVLLFGNHDYHYLKSAGEISTGFQPDLVFHIAKLFHQAIKDEILKMCYVNGKFLFVHAGITKTWARNNNIDLNNLEQSVNDLFKYKPKAFGFEKRKNSSFNGDDIFQTPVWVRPRSLKEDALDGYIQIVGHTKQRSIEIYNTKKEILKVIFIDTIGTSGEYLQIIDGNPSSIKL